MQRSRVYSFTDPESEEHAASEIIRTRASVKYKDFFIVFIIPFASLRHKQGNVNIPLSSLQFCSKIDYTVS